MTAIRKLTKLSLFVALTLVVMVIVSTQVRVSANEIDYKQWDRGGGWFTDYQQTVDTNRWYDPDYRFTKLPAGIEDFDVQYCVDGPFGYCKLAQLVVRDTYLLYSACAEEDTACYEDRGEPVLFIHGYTRGTEEITGGGERTWADFPRLLQEVGYVPFEYRWNTGTRFEDAAIELEKAVDLIHEKTGKRVHIIAHSFGGLLVRTLLQGIHLEPAQDKAIHGIKMSLSIASVVTLGTPHSGIFPRNSCRSDEGYPEGQEDPVSELAFSLCGQLSCQQTGERMVDEEAAKFFGVEDEPGELMPKLADLDSNPLPAVNILSLIGMTTRRGGDSIVDNGDGLITYEGQRFLPGDSVDPSSLFVSCDEELLERRDPPWPLRHSASINKARVTERILGFPDNTVPGGFNPNPGDGGYRHSNTVWGNDGCAGETLLSCNLEQPPAEPYVECEHVAECDHESLVEVLNWLSAPPVCNHLTEVDPVPSGYGASYNVFNTSQMMVSILCSSAISAIVTAGNGDQNTYVYNQGYTYTNGSWKLYTLNCSQGQPLAGAWCVGEATKTLSTPTSGQNFLVAYTCQWRGGAWKCGCSDTTCATPKWQLQIYGR